MNVIERIVKKYFDKNSSPGEKKDSYHSLINSESEYLRYFAEDEWETFIDADKNENKQQTPTDRRIVFYKWTAYAAASVILLLFVFWLAKLNFPDKKPQVAEQKITASPLMIVRLNSSAITENIVLSDSSVVELTAGSKISYLENFEPGRRTIQLEGTAIFKVSKNLQRPFTVFCKEVATTAVGTTFKVSYTRSGNVVVELLEGKILVRRSARVVNDKKDQYYLVAGNAISFDRTKNLFTKIINKLADEDYKVPIAAADKPSTETLAKPAESHSERRVETANSIQFSDERLPKVLDYLAVAYKVKIIYPTKYISRIRFVGKVFKNEDIQKILQNLVMMNDLELKRDTVSNVFIIQIPAAH